MKKLFFLLIFVFSFEISYADNKIAYIDINHILNNSIVGKSISKHILNIKEKKQVEFLSIEKKLSDKEKDIINKKNIVEKKIFDDEVKILKEEINDYRNKKKEFNKQLDNQKIEYTKKVLSSLNPIISKYVEENSISIVFPKKNILIAKKKLDITKPIMELLNSQLSKIDF
tara:strand:+ start:212 stop:724 length:513 start_codon:yes stop_codon:yes gene_type:complete